MIILFGGYKQGILPLNPRNYPLHNPVLNRVVNHLVNLQDFLQDNLRDNRQDNLLPSPPYSHLGNLHRNPRVVHQTNPLANLLVSPLVSRPVFQQASLHYNP